MLSKNQNLVCFCEILLTQKSASLFSKISIHDGLHIYIGGVSVSYEIKFNTFVM